MTALHPHEKGFLQKGMKVATIDHSIWFHRPFDMNDWLLYAIESNNAYAARGLARGQFFSADSRLIATTQQEGLIRYLPEEQIKGRTIKTRKKITALSDATHTA